MYPSQVEFLQHILDECRYLLKEARDNSFDNFISDARLTRAICRSLEIIGEASGKLHPELKMRYPLVPWREMSDIRNKIIHNYFGVDYEIVWDTVENNISDLKDWVEIMIVDETGS
jgi:uncharacterized protein with HEPN domain